MSGAKTPLKSFDLSSFRYDPLRREAKGTNITATRTRLEREDGELDVNAGALAKLQSSQPTSQSYSLHYTLQNSTIFIQSTQRYQWSQTQSSTQPLPPTAPPISTQRPTNRLPPINGLSTT